MSGTRVSRSMNAVLVAAAFVLWLAPPIAAKQQNLPYTTIDHPQFVSASQASFLDPKDIVLGVTDGKTTKAYPAAILSQHGVVQDSTADGPIAVTW